MRKYRYFMFDPNDGFETYQFAEQAESAAQEAIDWYRGEACDGWDEQVDQVCWGEIKQNTVQVGLRPRTEEDNGDCDMICDYQLSDI